MIAIEITRDGQDSVADRLGLKPAQWVGGEQRIGRVEFERFGRGAARLLPGSGEDEVADELLE